ncbi:MAG: twitching motility protein [Candidatus Amesbacteria bacterium GW2011_GWA1_46_35]|uniref:Twitching motility protein n=1 Tax=Candidatus Amesbacteria bacterium GW2011_GWC2_45_19 TaxID=1618366 RepID=A0A0G1PC29_9BACT|nr:MAG: twitching motility protein [Candidatus Amesbacteria bacterium GW2011_GWC2_45_19]KKU38358.1 MAG: twitching motility protein [Candidatus Amesbacteria bacterium GW2011_GWA1_46_35]KKU68799.1 MAG: twitching motility protein [Microgenomates group bacterium GW2011_GWC1_47_20]
MMKTIQELLQYVIDNKASDLHVVAGAPPTIRLDGVLVPVAAEEAVTPLSAGQLINGVLTAEQKEVLTVNRELDFSFTLAEKARFRVNAYQQKGSMAAAFRLVPAVIPGIDELGLPKICHQFAVLKQGFILVTGPTGHGKSTTLAAILEEINRTRPVHIVTVEDPIEYVYSSNRAVVSQREIRQDTHSWEIALRSALREDPDVVLIGEMRDFETIAAALTIAETGHLVFATLHTNSAAQTVDRIVDVFPESQQAQAKLQLSANLEAVLSQRLVPKIAGGRTLAYEIMLGTGAVRTAIREGRTHTLDNIITTSAEVGMVTLESSLAGLVKSGAISLETAQAYGLERET